MSTSSKNTSSVRKLSAILFADIVGYTSLMQKDEATANILLDKFHKTLSEKVIFHKGQVINNYGDGCVCTFDSAVAAMNCAKDVQLIFQKQPTVPVRIGLHSGDVMFKDDNVYGDSVNIASRIESLGVAGAVLFSKQIKRHISNQKEFEVQSLGEFDFKNVEKTMEVFALANKGMVIPKQTEIKGKVNSSKRKWVLPAIICTLGLIGILLFQSGFFSKKEFKEGEVSLAIVPFRNISGDKTNNHFGMGMASEIRTKLSLSKKFAYLSSLQATTGYSNSEKTPQEIGEALNVDYLLMGMFQIAGEDIRVNIELLDAASGKSVEELPQFQNKFTDIFKLQSEIANQVLNEFSFFKQSDLPQKAYEPDVLAYGHYLKGNEIMASDHSLDAFNNAIIQYEAAIQLDSNYLSAWVGIINAKTLILFSFNKNDTLQQEVGEIMDYVETHFPESWEKNLARGLYNYLGLLNYEKGRLYFQKVIEDNPENYLVNYNIAAIYKRYLQPKEAFYHFGKAKAQNPLNAIIWTEIGFVQENHGAIHEAIKSFKTALRLEDVKIFKAKLFDLSILLGEFTEMPNPLKKEYRNDCLFYENYFKLNWEKCLTILDTTTSWATQIPDIDFKADGIFHRKMEIYFITDNVDSSKYYAQQLLAYYDRHPNNINIDRKANALSILNRHKESIALIQSGAFNNGTWLPIPKEDKSMLAEKMVQEVRNYTLQSDYKKATAILLQLNKKFPNYGKYYTFRTDPLYNRIKKEYPLFAKALNELKLPEIVPFDAPLKG